jgi:hypothetical protein
VRCMQWRHYCTHTGLHRVHSMCARHYNNSEGFTRLQWYVHMVAASLHTVAALGNSMQ